MHVIYREKAAFLDILLVVFTVGMLGLPETNLSISAHMVILVTYLILRFRPTPLSPYFFLAPVAVYLVLGVSYLFIFPMAGSSTFFNGATVGLIAFSVALRIFYEVNSKQYSDQLIHRRPIVHLFLWALISLLISQLMGAVPGMQIIGKVLAIAVKPTLLAIVLGSLAAIATQSLIRSMAFLFVFSSYVILVNYLAIDLNRLLFLDLLLFAAISVFFAVPFTRNRVFQGSRTIAFLFIPLIIAQFSILYYMPSLSVFGGDWRIVGNAIDLMSAAKGRPEPFMPFFNNFFIFVPDALWISEKPTNYNASAWYISTIMDANPEHYPWGVGVTLFGAGYLYGGYVGIGLIFFVVGLFCAWISKQVRNPFWVGFLAFFLMRLPFGFYRMDEMFVFGALVPTMGVIYLFSRFARRRINGCFAPSAGTDLTPKSLLARTEISA